MMLPQWNISQPPLGIAYLTAFLRSRGVSAEQRDFSAELLNNDKRKEVYYGKQAPSKLDQQFL